MGKLIIPAELIAIIISLIRSGVDLIGDYSEDELRALAAGEEARSDALQKRQEEG